MCRAQNSIKLGFSKSSNLLHWRSEHTGARKQIKQWPKLAFECVHVSVVSAMECYYNWLKLFKKLSNLVKRKSYQNGQWSQLMGIRIVIICMWFSPLVQVTYVSLKSKWLSFHYRLGLVILVSNICLCQYVPICSYQKKKKIDFQYVEAHVLKYQT